MTTQKRSKNMQKIRQDLRVLIRDSEALLKAEGEELAERGQELRDRLAATLEAAKSSYHDLEDKAWDEVEALDQTIHNNPYQFLGVACGLGILVGLYLNRR